MQVVEISADLDHTVLALPVPQDSGLWEFFSFKLIYLAITPLPPHFLTVFLFPFYGGFFEFSALLTLTADLLTGVCMDEVTISVEQGSRYVGR